ncbi:CHAT domain-containing protein [Truncatella angustata]|uniref:CHAT domain-containing protein n=1 Tax=Truncatella angustata TaxID=152316 RepID=A0A9P8RIJ9_9PEZI|nr:CHAT domain-containing protein [Truncatella angustata]KAH6644998.1 CHAT domain-containing protein [Truncatella angustata]
MALPLKNLNQGLSVAELDDEMQKASRTIVQTELGSKEHVYALHRMGVIYRFKYEKTRKLADITESVRLGQEAIHGDVEDEFETDDILSMYDELAASLSYLFGVNRQVRDIDAAIHWQQKALLLSQEDSYDMWWARKRLVQCIHTKAAHTRKMEFIEDAIKRLKTFIEEPNDSNPYFADLLSRFAGTLVMRYKESASQDLEDLEMAIRYGYEASSIEDLTERDQIYAELATDLREHHQATGLFGGLEESLRITKLNLASQTRESRWKFDDLCDYGSRLLAKCHRMNNTRADPDEFFKLFGEAIEVASEAEKICYESSMPDGDKIDLLILFGEIYCLQQSLEDDLSHGVRAISLLQQALFHGPENHWAIVRALSTLSKVHEAQHNILKKLGHNDEANEHLKQAVEHERQVLDSFPDKNNPIFAEHCQLSGELLIKAYTENSDESLLKLAIRNYMAALRAENGSPVARITAGMAASLFMENDQDAHQVLQHAMAILPQLNPQDMAIEDLQYTLRQVSGLSSMAAARALGVGRPVVEALSSLETANCIITGTFINTREDLSQLRLINSQLAGRYELGRTEMSTLTKQQNTAGGFFTARSRARVLSEELKAIETQIREVEGFKKFQKPFDEEDFRALASEGPIVTINVSPRRCDAIIVTEEHIDSIALPLLTEDELEKRLAELGSYGNDARRDARLRRKKSPDGQVSGILSWLYTVAVKPILDATPLKPGKRIWWVAAGLAGRAPLHAAGNHQEGSTDNAQARVISSYTPSFRALRHARNQPALNSLQRSMLLVTVASNPAPHRSLNTQYEEEVTKRIFDKNLTHLSQPDPESVLRELPHHPFVHFACHGVVSVLNPSESGLVLVKDNRPAMVTVSDLQSVQIKAGLVAYLSACSTAEQKDPYLVDEALHLSSVFQALGFRHVIGTVWGADDFAAGEVARRFYEKISSALSSGQSSELHVAKALHDAVLEYKAMVDPQKDVLKWAPFVHIGT